MINLDTHVFVHALAGTPTAREQRILETHEWSVSAIVLWELAKLVQLGRQDQWDEEPDRRADVQRRRRVQRVVGVCYGNHGRDFVRDYPSIRIDGDQSVHMLISSSATTHRRAVRCRHILTAAAHRGLPTDRERNTA